MGAPRANIDKTAFLVIFLLVDCTMRLLLLLVLCLLLVFTSGKRSPGETLSILLKKTDKSLVEFRDFLQAAKDAHDEGRLDEFFKEAKEDIHKPENVVIRKELQRQFAKAFTMYAA